MTACDRFEREGLLQLEQGEPLDPHFEECTDCRAARRSYQRLQARLTELGHDDLPSKGWEQRLLARARRRRSSNVPLLWTALAASIALAALLLPHPRVPASPSLTATTHSGGELVRGPDVHPSDSLLLEAHTAGARHAELRVYLNDDKLVLQCAKEAPCRRQGDRLAAILQLKVVGLYQPLLLVSEHPLPAPSGALDVDVRSAGDHGADIVTASEIEVR